MTPTKESTKKWLKEIGKNREWLASECETEKGTINNWLSPSGPFPASAVLKIHDLMGKFPAPTLNTSPSPQEVIPPSILPDLDERGKMFLNPTEESQKAIYEEADRLNMTPSTYCTLAAEWCCEQPNIGELLLRRLNAQKKASRTESGGTSDTGILENRRHLSSQSAERDETA